MDILLYREQSSVFSGVLRQMAATRKLYGNTLTGNTAVGSSDKFRIHREWNSVDH